MELIALPFLFICNGIPILIGLAATIFWIIMLIDLVQRDFPANKENEKLLWILVVLLGNGIGAIIYYFVVKNNPEYNNI